MTASVYLDHNATTPIRPQAAEAVVGALSLVANPSSVHRPGRLARRTIEEARERVAALVDARPADVVFTSGGTEANALALRAGGSRRVLVSAVEHASVLDAAPKAERLPVTGDGMIDLAALEAQLAAGGPPALVCVMLANNETGVIQPVSEVVPIARRFGARVHCDAVQAAGKIAIDWTSLGAHTLSLSAHKIGGPKGSGALIVAPEVAIEPLLKGGGQERGRRAGTENVPGIAGFGAAAEAVSALADAPKLASLRDRIESGIRTVASETPILGSGAARLPNTTCLAMLGLASETQVIAFDLAGIAVSAGSACSSGKVAMSHVLRAMGIDEEIAGSAIRVSVGWTTTEADVDRFVEVWGKLYARSRTAAEHVAPAA